MWPSTSAKQTRRHRQPVMPGTVCLMNMTVPNGSITSLRHVVMRVCGEELQFMRVDTCARTGQADVRLCVAKAVMAPALEAITHYLPDVKFASFSDTVL